MAWSSTPYSALPTSPARSNTNSPSHSSSSSYPPQALPAAPRRPNRLVFLLFGLAVVLFGSTLLVPHERLPTPVQGAVAKGKEAYEAAKAGAMGTWSWQEQAGVELEDDGVPAASSDPLFEAGEKAADEEKEVDVEVEENEQELDHAVILPLPTSKDDALDVEEEPVEEEPIVVGELEEEILVVCSKELKKAIAEPSFWVVTETADLTYKIAARDALDPDVSEICLSQAVFTARLVSGPSTPYTKPSAAVASSTVLSLEAPLLGEDLSSYDLVIPSDLAVPSGEYELDVRLDFGLYVGVQDATICGEEARSCNPVKLSEKEGEELKYVGKKVEVVGGKTVKLGRDDLASPASLPLCTDLSALTGFWSSSSYTPTDPFPCSLATPAFPMPFVSTTNPSRTPLWIHLVGDSNTRNMYNHLLSSLGDGSKINAPKVVDSATHNGTVASVAFRWADGLRPVKDLSHPDVIVTWQWWYQKSPPPSATAAQFDRSVAANRDELLKAVDTTFYDYLAYSNQNSMISSTPSLVATARTLRPHRTYLSLGSHGEELVLAGLSSSLSSLFSDTSGLSRAKRERANLRLFTTTLVNARYIPLARFPHQDLVRANALIVAKNEYAASREELGGEGRVIDVEKLTRGIVEEDGWMKATKSGPDAVHFREEVYDEWVRLVWTDLSIGAGAAATAVAMEEEEGGVEEARRRWKRRIAGWEPEEDEEED